MFSWKERLYAILLRRVLGPLLSPHSLPKLHSCVSQVSIADGTYTLTNVELNADYLTTRLEQQQQQGGSSNANHHHQQQQTTLGLLRFVSVVVGKLHVEIRLVEQQPEVEPGDAPNSSKETSNGSSSLAWRAFQLGNGTSSSSSVALVVRVRLEDVVVTVEAAAANVVPLAATTQTEEIDTPQPPSITPVQSFLSSYIEAALSSLRLSIELVRARVRIQETTDPPNETTTQQQQQQQAPSSSSSDLYTAMRPRHQKWLEIRIQSASYRDNSNDINGGSMTNNASAVANNQNQNTSATLAGSSTCGNESSSSSFTYETVLYKVLEVTRITLVTGHCTSSEPSSSASSIVSLLEGTSRCSLRLNQYPLDPNDPMTKEPKQQYRQQHDIQLILNQKLNVSLDVTTLQHIISIAKSCKSRPMGANEANCPVDAHGTFDGNTTPVPRSLFLADGSTTTTTTDEADYDAIRGIMQQYEEARKLVERREMRGGMLVPTVDSGGGVTFDTFFDANEHAFGRYSSGMMDSIVVDTRNDSSAEKSTNTIGNNHVNTKVIFHLQEGGVKIAFLPSRDSGDSTPNEYILLTFNDVNLSSQISRQSTKHAFTIGHLELEDSYRKTGPHCDTRKQCASFTNEISTLLLFSPFLNGDDDDDEEDDPILLVRPPCVALTVETFISNDQDSLVAELNLLPMEISYRSHLVAHVADLVSQLQSVVTENGLSDELSDMHTVILSESKPRVRSINVTCSSLVVSMPVVTEQDWDVLYSRSGYVSQGALTKTSSLGLLFECLEAELVQKIDESSSFSISSHNIVYYANSPKGAGNVFDQTSDRFDMFALCGLNEIDPCIPVELRITQCGLGNSSETANISAGLAVENFPVVPLLSSFKTRQDDDETEVARGTKICDKNKSKNQLRASDEQDSMLAKVKKSEVVVSVNIPEFVVDVSRKELMLLRDILDSLRPESTDKRNAQPKDQLQVPKIVSFTINCDDISLAVHSERDESFSDQYTDGSDSAQFSFLVKMDRLRSHLLFEGTAMRHSRLLMQEVDAFEILNLCRKETLQEEACVDKRVERLRQRCTSHEGSLAAPLVYRSHIFTPISRESPCVLIDFINLSSATGEMARKKLYVTAYDTSFRYDMDSRWTTRLASIVQSFNGKESKNEQRQTENYQSLTQVFLSVVDCNFDYSSPQRFSTAARKILRIGDLRISSNVVTPYTSMQACTVSVGDVSFYLCNCRYPYNYENARLLGAKSILKQHQLLAPLGLFEDSDLDDIHRRMNYKIVATLDSIDAIITLSNAQDPIEANPPICINVTIGQLCVFACKDTLSRLTDSIGELSRVMTALSDDALSKLREKSDESRRLQGINKTELDRIKQKSSGMLKEYPLKSSGLLSHESSKNSFGHPDFLIDGYDWMTIDAEEKTHVHGEEQARWYNSDGDASFLAKDEHDAVVENSVGDTQKLFRFGNHIITHHFPLRPVSDPIGDGDMGLSKYAGIQTKPQVKCRLMVHDLSFRIRLFDGYDWPEMLDEVERGAPTCDAFVIPVAVSPPVSSEEETDQPTIIGRTIDVNPVDRKSQLMVDLLAGDPAHGSPFENIPLPGERKMTLKEQAEKRRLSRRTSKYFQFDISGVSVRLDSIEESTEHRIASCLNLKVQDLFLAETISSNRPVKLLGEWFNEQEHPRDFNDGLVMMKMVTWHPEHRLTEHGEVASEESEVGLTVLPLRCIIDQRAIAFARAFFHSPIEKVDSDDSKGLPPHLHSVPPPVFTTFRVRSFKLKVDYRPQRLDTKALRNGSVVELINLSPLDGMILKLKEVAVVNELGMGAVMSIVVGRWVEDILETQLLKFVTNSRPFEPITEVSGAAVDMVVLPLEAFRNGESIEKALRSGAKSLSKTLMYEFFNMTSRAAEFVAGNASLLSSSLQPSDNKMEGSGALRNLLPCRPLAVPRHMMDAGPHAIESLSRGFQAANYKIVIVPYREYHRTGAGGAVRSVLRGIPVAIAAPASGAAEALSFALLGARNQIRPDIRKEEEASMRGLQMD